MTDEDGEFAVMDPWMIVAPPDMPPRLFGFLRHHPKLGGKSWSISSPIVNLTGTKALTESGMDYVLGKKITIETLPTEEARVALCCLLEMAVGLQPDRNDQLYLAACKIARWIDQPVPDRQDTAQVLAIIKTHGPRYLQIRRETD